VARCGDLPVGYTFGYPLPPDTGWWKAMEEETTAEFAAETGQRTLAIVELAVRAGWRRQGVAARLHAHLHEGLGVERVTLAMRPDPEAAPAHATYTAWGYRQVGHWQPAHDEPVSHIMLLTLPCPSPRIRPSSDRERDRDPGADPAVSAQGPARPVCAGPGMPGRPAGRGPRAARLQRREQDDCVPHSVHGAVAACQPRRGCTTRVADEARHGRHGLRRV